MGKILDALNISEKSGSIKKSTPFKENSESNKHVIRTPSKAVEKKGAADGGRGMPGGESGNARQLPEKQKQAERTRPVKTEHSPPNQTGTGNGHSPAADIGPPVAAEDQRVINIQYRDDQLIQGITSNLETSILNKIRQEGANLYSHRPVNEVAATPLKPEDAAVAPLPLPVPVIRKELDAIKDSDVQLVVTAKEEAEIKESFKIIRTKLLKFMRRRGLRTFIVTSALEGEGKTFISSNLAASIALGFDEYVLLVDADFHKAHLNRHFNVDKVKGLSDYLSGDEPDLGKLFRSTGIPKLSALFAGTKMENAVYKLSSDLMQKLIAHMKTRYTDRYIIIDTPPAQLPETIALSSVVDGVVVVIDPKKSDKQVIQNTLELIDKEKILGIILNRYKRNKQELYTYQYYR